MSTMFSRGRTMLVRDLWAHTITETGSLYLRSTGDSYGSADTVTAIRRVLKRDDARVASGLVAAGTIAFLLRASTVTSAPRQNDKYVDANSVEWHIDHSEYIAFDSCYRIEVTQAVS